MKESAWKGVLEMRNLERRIRPSQFATHLAWRETPSAVTRSWVSPLYGRSGMNSKQKGGIVLRGKPVSH